ncbi:hypothetical protein HK28_01040 [Acetobacter sp. DsW_063]|nr:hypothetical protein HK28_01040 [Acetobacter sp. DsW_063]
MLTKNIICAQQSINRLNVHIASLPSKLLQSIEDQSPRLEPDIEASGQFGNDDVWLAPLGSFDAVEHFAAPHGGNGTAFGQVKCRDRVAQSTKDDKWKFARRVRAGARGLLLITGVVRLLGT